MRFDIYEEVIRGLSETNMANLNFEINELLTKWAASKQGYICRMNKESSLMGFSMSAVMDMMEDKFMILDKVREIRSGNKIPPTVSIGVACDGVTLEELIGNAKATQNGNSVAGDKLRLTNTNVAIADGNVDSIYIPEQQPALPGKEKQGADDKALA